MAEPRSFGHTRPSSAPDYDRVMASLSDAELEDEIAGGRGEPGYRLALVTEHERRARRGPPAEGGKV